MKERINQYRPAAAAFLVMMAMALTSSAMSFFIEPLCEELQVGRGSFSINYSLITISGALSNSFLGRYAGKKGVRNILWISGIWTCVGFFLFSIARSLWIFYIVAFCMGVFATSCVALCGNVIVQQAYLGAQASGILGVVMAGSGVGGMIFSLIIPRVITSIGWQTAYRIMGICWLVFLWLAALLLGKPKMQTAASVSRSVGLGMTYAEAMRSPKLYLQMIVICIVTACCGIQQHLPSLLGEQGFSSEEVSLMISVMTACLAIGKVAQGLLYGKMGIQKGGYVMLLVFAVSFLLLSGNIVYPGLIALAFGMGVYTTLLPQVARQTFGSREYAAIWGVIATAGSVGSFIANPAWGLVYDFSGSYMPGLFAAPVLLLVALAALVLTFREKK